MSEREKDIIKTIADALPAMSEFDKGYFLGVAERAAMEKKKAKESEPVEEQKAG